MMNTRLGLVSSIAAVALQAYYNPGYVVQSGAEQWNPRGRHVDGLSAEARHDVLYAGVVLQAVHGEVLAVT